jgi:caffeoyl-CoA O-methyltransferase
MEFLPPHIDDYAEKHTSNHSDLLEEVFRHTVSHVSKPRMISGKIQGRFLSMLSHLINPKYILEVGTYTGYSALCLAEGLDPQGELHTIDNNDELKELQENFFSKSVFSHQIYQHTGNALNIIPTLDYTWNLVFIDADKSNYQKYYEMIIPAMKPGGLIISDNVLWSGKVTDSKVVAKDTDTAALDALNKFILADDRVENILLPIRDGLMLARVL